MGNCFLSIHLFYISYDSYFVLWKVTGKGTGVSSFMANKRRSEFFCSITENYVQNKDLKI